MYLCLLQFVAEKHVFEPASGTCKTRAMRYGDNKRRIRAGRYCRYILVRQQTPFHF
jgi:hypothetical protein